MIGGLIFSPSEIIERTKKKRRLIKWSIKEKEKELKELKGELDAHNRTVRRFISKTKTASYSAHRKALCTFVSV